MAFVELLGKKWQRHYSHDLPADEAYLVSHGRYMQLYGFTELASPSDIHFYVFHQDKIFFGEISQIMNFAETVHLGGGKEFRGCQPKVATSIMGANATCWNYHLGAYTKAHYNFMCGEWKKGGSRNDLLIMEPNKGGFKDLLSGENRSTLNGLFEVLRNNNLRYSTIHFLCCRSGIFAGSTRSTKTDTAELLTPSTPYWKRPKGG